MAEWGSTSDMADRWHEVNLGEKPCAFQKARFQYHLSRGMAALQRAALRPSLEMVRIRGAPLGQITLCVRPACEWRVTIVWMTSFTFSAPSMHLLSDHPDGHSTEYGTVSQSHTVDFCPSGARGVAYFWAQASSKGGAFSAADVFAVECPPHDRPPASPGSTTDLSGDSPVLGGGYDTRAVRVG